MRKHVLLPLRGRARLHPTLRAPAAASAPEPKTTADSK